MKRIILNTAFITIIIYTAFSCNKDSVISTEEDQPGRRDYVWTVDTINSYDPIYRFWASSPTDAWAVTTGGNLSESIFHFDGNHWSTDGVFRLLSPHSIWGSSNNNAYIGGSAGKIWHFDGNSWSEVATLTKDGHDDIVFDNIWGGSYNDFYIMGAYHNDNGAPNNSVITHFNDNIWTSFDTDNIIGIVERLYKNKTDGKIYLRTNRIGGGEYFDSTLIYKYDQGKYSEIYSSVWTRGLQADISFINNEVYFVLGSKISKRINGQFKTILEVNNPNFNQKIWGRSSKDIFLLMIDGLVHYNGSDMKYLFHFNKSSTEIFGAALFENDAFFLVSEAETNLSLIYHGKLE